MKAKSILSLCGASTHRHSNLILAAGLFGLLGSQSARAVDATWAATAVDGAWSNGTNWSTTPVPGSLTGEKATFAANIVTAFRVIDLGAGVTIKTIVFSANGAAFTIGSGAVGSQTLTLEAAASIAPTAVNGSTPLINAKVNLGTSAGDDAFGVTNNSDSQGIIFAGAIGTTQLGIKTLTVGGAGASLISGNLTDYATPSATDKLVLTKNGGSTLSLSGSNTYSGATSVNAGVLSFRNKAARSPNTAVTAIAAGAVALGVKGSDSLFYDTADLDALFNGIPLAGFTLDPTSGVGIDTSAGDFTYATSLLSTVTRGLIKVGGNALTLAGTNAYTGQTQIREGSISVASLATNLSTTQINLGNGNTSGALIYTGTGEDVSRVVRLNGAAGSGTINQSGTGHLKFSGNVTAAAGAAKTLTLTGSTAGTAEIAGVIGNGSATIYTGVIKTGTGKWTLSAANTYGRADGTTATGKTTISGGILALGATGFVGASLAASAVVVNNSGTFAVTPGLTTTTNNSIATTGGTTLTMNAGSVFTMVDGFTNTFNMNGTPNLYGGTPGVAPALNFEVTGTNGVSDSMVINGAASITNPGALINITPTGPLTIGHSFTIATATSGLDSANTWTLGNGGVVGFGPTAYGLSLVNTATSSTVTVISSAPNITFYTGDQGTTLNVDNSGNTNWSSDSAGTDNLSEQPAALAEMVFSADNAAHFTIAELGQDFSVKSLTFNDAVGASAVTLNDTSANGNNTLTVSAGIIVETDAPASTINVPVILGAAQTWSNSTATGPLTVSGSVTNGGFPLTVSGTGSTAVSGIISGSGALSVNPGATDTSAVVLSGANSYTGGLTLQAGSVTLQNDQSLASGSITVGSNMIAGATLTIDAGASVALASDKTFQVGTTGTGGLTGVAATASVAGAVINPGALRVGRLGILDLTSGATWAQSGDMTIQGAGNITAQMTIGTGAGLTCSGANTIKVQPPTGAFAQVSRLTVSGVLTTSQGFEAVNDATGNATGQVLLDDGTLKLSASIPTLFLADGVGVDATKFALANTGTIDTNGFDTAIAQVITGTGGLTKEGGGLLTLTAANTYTGDTTANTGTLEITDDAELRFVTGDTSGSGNNLLSGAGTVTLNGDFNINTAATDASALASGSWVIENAASLPAAYGNTFIVVGWNDEGDETWTKSVGTKNYTFDELTGTVSMIDTAPPADPYISWIDSYTPNPLLPDAASKLPTADPDGDGITNLMEFVLGGSPVVSSMAILPTQVIVGSNVVLSYQRSDESESPAITQLGQWSTNLSTWNDVTPILVNENAAAPDDMTVTVPTSNEMAGKLFLRLKVVK